jgi:hypothetical protein
VTLGSFGTPCPRKKEEKKKKKHKREKKKGVGRVLFSDTLSITLVVFGPPIGGIVCLSKCRDGVVDCFCESLGQWVYGPRIGFLGHFDPCRCKTDSSITSSHVARSLGYAHL